MEQEIQSSESFDDSQRTPPKVRRAIQELLKFGFVELSEKQEIYQCIIQNQPFLEAALEPLDLTFTIDDRRGMVVVFVRVDEECDVEDSWAHPLIRRQRLTLEQSLMVAILRQYYVVQELELGVGVKEIKMPMDVLIDQMFKYLPDSGSDSKNERRVSSLVEKLKVHGVVSEPDKNKEVTIRPLISHLANPSTLKALLEQFTRLADSSGLPISENYSS